MKGSRKTQVRSSFVTIFVELKLKASCRSLKKFGFFAKAVRRQ
jgi:hypothetical protein